MFLLNSSSSPKGISSIAYACSPCRYQRPRLTRRSHVKKSTHEACDHFAAQQSRRTDEPLETNLCPIQRRLPAFSYGGSVHATVWPHEAGLPGSGEVRQIQGFQRDPYTCESPAGAY